VRAPCSRAGHHAYLGGLLEHTVGVATLAHELCLVHPGLNPDLLLTAALLHDIGKIREFELGAEIARRQGRTEEWVSGLHSAVAAQDKLPYMEPPYWYYPTRHNLGAALVELKRFAEAEGVYREDLKHNPHNGRALFGLMQALRGQGKTDVADEVQREFDLAWIRADVKLTNSRY